MRKLTLFVILPSAFLLNSCAKVSSSEVKSGGIYATYHVTGDTRGGAKCEAIFQVGAPDGTYISLENGDQVTCDGARMEKAEVLGITTYSTKVAYDLAKTYTVVLTRAGEAPYSADMKLPEPFSITSPRADDRLGGGSGIELKWTLGASVDYDLTVAVTGAGGATVFSSDYPDKGSKFLTTDSLKIPDGSSSENFTATVTRSKAGSFPQGLAGGRSAGRQTASVTFTVTR